MRMRGHSEHDDASYVPKELIEEWSKRDPIQRLEVHLRAQGIMDDSLQSEVSRRIEREIEAGRGRRFERAEEPRVGERPAEEAGRKRPIHALLTVDLPVGPVVVEDHAGACRRHALWVGHDRTLASAPGRVKEKCDSANPRSI